MFGNGQSTSPSNTTLRPFPNVTFHDNVRAQHRLITAHLGIRHARAVVGWSMAAGQTFQWATQFPDFMDIAVPFCGASRTSLHNQVMIEGVKVALITAAKQVSAGVLRGAKFDDGESSRTRTWSAEEKDRGLRSLGRVYAGWGFSQPFYREKLYESYLGFKDLEDFMVNFWEKWATSKGSSALPLTSLGELKC
jgi:pimeloyl-ACP methyl ester carboxylesterase